IGGRGLDTLDVLPRFREAVAEGGRNPDAEPMSVVAARQDTDLLKRYRDAGIDRVVFLQPTVGRDEARKNLDAAATYVRAVGEIHPRSGGADPHACLHGMLDVP